MQWRKGVSPLIATVLLIAFVFAAAFIFGEWLTPFTEQQTALVENESDRFESCAYTNLDILDARASEDHVNLTLVSSGFNGISGGTVVALKSGRIIANQSIGALGSSQMRSIMLATDGKRADRAVAISYDCPMRQDEERFAGFEQ